MLYVSSPFINKKGELCRGEWETATMHSTAPAERHSTEGITVQRERLRKRTALDQKEGASTQQPSVLSTRNGCIGQAVFCFRVLQLRTASTSPTGDEEIKTQRRRLRRVLTIRGHPQTPETVTPLPRTQPTLAPAPPCEAERSGSPPRPRLAETEEMRARMGSHGRAHHLNPPPNQRLLSGNRNDGHRLA